MSRPTVGPKIEVRFPAATLDLIDRWAADNETSRADMIRRLTNLGVAAIQDQAERVTVGPR